MITYINLNNNVRSQADAVSEINKKYGVQHLVKSKVREFYTSPIHFRLYNLQSETLA